MDTIHDKGWIKLHRKILNSQVFQNEGLFKVWIWCLLKANHQAGWVPITTGKGTTEAWVKRSQFLFGRTSAAKTLKMDESTVYKRMMKLKTMRNCDIQSHTHYSIVTILNYEDYQGNEKEEVTGKVTSKEHPRNTNKNDKNIKNRDIARSDKPKRAIALADADFIQALKENPAYKGIDIDREIGKMDAWLLTPRGKGKQRTRQRLVAWLNKAERPMADNTESTW